MLKMFKVGRPDHPMADPKEARRILDALPPQELKALEELAHWHESVSSAEGFKPADRVQALLGLEDAAQARVRKLGRDYFGAARPSRYQENLMWTRLHEYWRQAGLAWARTMDHVLQSKGVDAKAIAVPAARGLRALSQQIKWQHMRYGPIDPAVWGTLNKVYAVAESRGAAEPKVSFGIAGESTPRQEFLKAALFSASSPDGLVPLEVELAERLVNDLSPSFRIGAEPSLELLYWTDLDKPMAPQRATKTPSQASGLRCFGPGEALATLQGYIQKIRATREIPSGINLGGTYDAEVALEVMEHLALYWAPDPPERQHARHPVKSRIAIANGFKAVVEVLGGSDVLAFDQSGTESWIVENVSAGGFGAVVPQIKGDWLRVGVLLAMQPDGGTNWVVGIVRRVNRVTNQEARVGIQTVSRAPSVVDFTLRGAGQHTGVLLPSPVLGSGEVSIALPASVYARGVNLEAEIGGKQHVYMPVGTAERGEDYELVRFREMIRDG
ncbi:MAG: hypothetical protein ACT4P4_06115 [Betaproteobacteria bacterium]